MVSPRSLPILATLALLWGCTDASVGDLQRNPGADAVAVPSDAVSTGDTGASADSVVIADGGGAGPDIVAPLPMDAATAAPDVVQPPPMDAVTPPPADVVVPPPDVVAPPPPDVVVPRPDVVAPPVDVVAPRPDVVVPQDVPPVCERCEPFSPVAFCRGSGSGACLAYAGCVDRCARCVAPTLAGDRCATAPVISARGRSRSAFTTCGATDNQSVGCGRSGLDIAVTLRVSRPGRVVVSMTVPEGAGVFFGYDRLPGMCRDETSSRACNDATPARTQGFDLPLAPGDWNLYIGTTAPTTVVIDAELP